MKQQTQIKVKINEVFDKSLNQIFFQLQFKFPDESHYKGRSYDMFKTYEGAEKALRLHESGERVYTYSASIEKKKLKTKGHKITISKKLAYHVLRTENDIPESLTWHRFCFPEIKNTYLYSSKL